MERICYAYYNAERGVLRLMLLLTMCNTMNEAMHVRNDMRITLNIITVRYK